MVTPIEKYMHVFKSNFMLFQVLYIVKSDHKLRSRIVSDDTSKQVIKNIALHNSKKRTANLLLTSSLKESIIEGITKELKKEIKIMNSTINNSLLRKIDSNSLTCFNVHKINLELQTWAPLLHQVLSTLSKSSKIGSTILAAISLKFTNTHMSAFQHIVGQILDHGGATDEVNK